MLLGDTRRGRDIRAMPISNSKKSLSRRAGWLYGLQGLPAPFAYLYVPNLLLVAGDPLTTVEHVRAHQTLLRAAIGIELLIATLLVFVAATFFRLFRDVDERLAGLFAAMCLASVPISFVNTLFHIAPLVLVRNTALAAQLGAGPTAALVGLSLRLHNDGLIVGQIFWGLWLFPLGLLVRRSSFLPRWLAFPLFAAGAGYIVASLGNLLLPPALRSFTQAGMFLGVGEFPLFTYMQWWGARSAETKASPPAPQVATGFARS